MAVAPNADDKVANTATDEDFDIVVEGEDQPKDAKAPRNEDDRRPNEDDDNDGDTEEEREKIREARRAERRERKERRAQAIERDKYQIDALARANRELQDRLAALEGRTLKQDASQIDERLAITNREYEQAERVLADAIAKGDGQLTIRAMKVRDNAIAQHRELSSVKARITEAPRRSEPGPDPIVARFASEWAEDNPWYDASGEDPDSAIVLAIDQSLARAGLDPRTEEYWDELDARVARALPERVKPARSSAKRSPPVAGGRDASHTRATGKQIFVSKERKQALIDAGKWDDPVARNRALSEYAKWDKANGRS